MNAQTKIREGGYEIAVSPYRTKDGWKVRVDAVKEGLGSSFYPLDLFQTEEDAVELGLDMAKRLVDRANIPDS